MNPVPTSPVADDIATASSRQVYGLHGSAKYIIWKRSLGHRTLAISGGRGGGGVEYVTNI